MDIASYLNYKSRDLLNIILNSSVDNKKKFLVDFKIKDKFINDSDKYPFIWLVQSLDRELLEIFLDKEGISILLKSQDLEAKLNALVTLEVNVADYLLTDENILKAIYDNYNVLGSYLVNKNDYFVQKFFDYIINNKLNIEKIADCSQNLSKILKNPSNLEKFIENCEHYAFTNKLIMFDNNTIELLLDNNYFKNLILNSDYDISNLVFKGIKFNIDILENPKFIDKLLTSEISKYRFMMNGLKKNNNLLCLDKIEKIQKQNYDEIIKSYDENLGMFKKYEMILNELVKDGKLISDSDLFELNLSSRLPYMAIYDVNRVFSSWRLKNEEKIKQLGKIFQKLTSREFGEILSDRYYEDIEYNFKLDLQSLIEFNQDVLAIGDKKLQHYEKLYEILDKKIVDSAFYNSFDKNKNYVEDFYDDFNLSRQKSYSLINDSLVDCNKIANQKNNKLSSLLNVDIYEFTGEEFYLLIHNTSISKYDDVSHIFDHYSKSDGTSLSLISNLKMDYFNDYGDSIVLGFNNLDIMNFVHVYNQDSYSSYHKNSGKVSDFRNKLYTPKRLMEETSSYNEIVYQIMTENTKNLSSALKPSYVVVFDDIKEADIKVAKKFNIPIIRIDREKYKDKVNHSLDGSNSFLSTDRYASSYFEFQNKHR